MNIKERMEKFNRRWNITSSDSYEESFKKFKRRILNILKDIDSHVTEDSINVFCQYYGIEERSKNIIDRLNRENNEKEFYKLIELIFTLDITSEYVYRGSCTYSKNILFDEVANAVNISDVNLAITALDDEIILYPKGEKKLDEELVDYVLSFLNEESGKHFIQSLQFYQSKDYIKSAESLRRSIEEFLKSKLKNSKGLQANIIELQGQLKKDGRDVQIRNIISQVFIYLDKYFNDNSKHNDGNINESENEFLIYQIGLLMRYINQNI